MSEGNYSIVDALVRFGNPPADRLNKACMWCASWMFLSDRSVQMCDAIAECRNLMCPLLPTGGAFWEPYPDGWTEENQRIWNAAKEHFTKEKQNEGSRKATRN